VTQIDQPDRYGVHFDETFDIIVVGYGFAGGTAAIEASDRGSSVLLAEKMPDPGGISITAGGGIRIADNADDAFAYLKASCDGRTDDAILRVFADEMISLADYIRSLAKVNDAVCEARHHPGNYPYPGFETFGAIEIASVPGFDPRVGYPHVQGRNRGPLLFKVVEDNVNKRAIEVRLGCTARRLTTDGSGNVTGVTLEKDGTLRRVRARKGVILACGGFEANREMQRQYWQISPVHSAASRGNTGDGIRMAQDVGADLWHMWHFHGSYGMVHPDPKHATSFRMKRLPDWRPEGTIDGRKLPANLGKAVKMSWIVLNKRGRRFMNEAPPYVQDTGHRPLDLYDAQTQSFPNIPAYVVIDEEGRKMYPLGQAVYNDRAAEPYVWSNDNLQEVELGILKQANSVAELAKYIGASQAAVQATLERWNGQCERGHDDDFDRPAAMMMPIRTAPFYIAEVWPVVSNTQGGPRHDARQRVLNTYGAPIPRLFEAGELGSIWGSLYLGGGNLSECFITGRIAAREANALADLASSD
jgi:succinate dehydrogenase/fumarate reductase flavoprotein subunit